MKTLMTTFFLMMVLISSAQAQSVAGSGRIEGHTGNAAAQVIVAGSGSYVCAAEDTFQDLPRLGRGETYREAQIMALEECRRPTTNNGFHCSVTSCERDLANGPNARVIFDITRDHKYVSISFSGNVRYACYVEAWGAHYVAKAPTRTEAASIARTACAYDQGAQKGKGEPDGFFCDVESCEQISGVKGHVGIGEIGRVIGKIGKRRK